MSTHEPLSRHHERADLAISGMSCASCAARVEKALAGVAGVDDCAVNFATDTATVHYDPARVTTDLMRAAVADLGYRASAPLDHARPGAGGEHDHLHHDTDADDIRRRLVVAVVLGVPVV